MERRTKLRIVAGGIAAFVLAIALGAGAALAAVGLLSDDDGHSPAAAAAAPDEEQLERVPTPFALPRLGGVPFGERGSDLFELRDLPFVRPAIDLDVAASYLGLSSAELHDELAEGRTLAEVARAAGKSVDGLVRELLEAAEERIDDAVEGGRLSEERARELRDGLEDRIRERVDEELGKFRFPLRDHRRDLERLRTPNG